MPSCSVFFSRLPFSRCTSPSNTCCSTQTTSALLTTSPTGSGTSMSTSSTTSGALYGDYRNIYWLPRLAHYPSHLLVARPTRSRALEVFVVDAAQRSTHVAMMVCSPVPVPLVDAHTHTLSLRHSGSCRPLSTTLPRPATPSPLLSANGSSINATKLSSTTYPALLPLPTSLLHSLHTLLSLGGSSGTIHTQLSLAWASSSPPLQPCLHCRNSLDRLPSSKAALMTTQENLVACRCHRQTSLQISYPRLLATIPT